MKYLKYFENAAAVGSGVDVDLPNVAYLETKNVLFVPGNSGTATVKVNSTTGEIEVETGPDYSSMYLTFEAIESGTFAFPNGITYSIDNGTTWVNLTPGSTTPTIAAGSKIMWKATLTPSGSSGIGTFSATGNFNVYGNIMSLLYGDNFVGQTDLTGKDYTFLTLFRNNTKIVNAQNLILPATTLAERCYQEMFYNCTGLTTAPATLPAATLTSRCYYAMFYNCRNLTTAPATLPATTLAGACYYGMFEKCTSLITAPELSATTLAENCCEIMFSGCTSLTTAPTILPATTLLKKCYYQMFRDCTSLTTAPALPATTLGVSCYQEMFRGCTNLTTAPALPATTLARECYVQMFRDCTSLTTAPALPATTLAEGCYQYMFALCTSLNYIKMLATDISASEAFKYWVYGVAATGTFVKAASMTTLPSGDSGIPSGWTVQDA